MSIVIQNRKIYADLECPPPNKKQQPSAILSDLTLQRKPFPGNTSLSESLYMLEQRESSVYIYSCYWHRDANNFKARILNTVFISTARSIIISIGKIMLIYIALPQTKTKPHFFCSYPPKKPFFPRIVGTKRVVCLNILLLLASRCE